MMMGIFILVALLTLVANSSGWSTPQKQTARLRLSSTPTSTTEDGALLKLNRRSFFYQAATIAIATSSITLSKPKVASATISYTKDQEKALAQWKDSAATIDNLLENWDTGDNISSGGGSQKEVGISGDAIRKELGTANFGKDVSPLFQIDKAFKVLRENDDIDLMEFTELSEEFSEVLASADSMAYSANFAGGSGNPSANKPRAFTDKARTEVVRLQQIAKSISALI